MIHGLCESIDGIWGIAQFGAAWSAVYPTPEQWEIKHQTIGFILLLNKIATNGRFRSELWTTLEAELDNYLDETLSLSPQARFNQGKLLYDVLGLFVGAGEINAILRSQRLIVTLAGTISKVPKKLGYLSHQLKILRYQIIDYGRGLRVQNVDNLHVGDMLQSRDGTSTLKLTENGWTDDLLSETVEKTPTIGEKFIVDTKGGSSRKWNKFLNRPTRPNTTYKVDQYTYRTDKSGRVMEVKGELTKRVRGRSTYQQSLTNGLKDGKAGDQAGQLIADIFYGPGEQINLLPMTRNLNLSAWKIMENTWSTALDQGKKVEVLIEPIYELSSKRPVAFEVEYWVNGVRNFEFFDN